VKIEQIDLLNAQPLKRFMTTADDIVRLIVNGAGIGLIGRTIDTALCGNDEPLTRCLIQPGKKATYQRFVVAPPIQIGGINKRDIQVDKFM